MNEQSRLEALVLRYEELQAEGAPATPAELCQDCPELAADLNRRLRALESMNAFLDAESEVGSAGLTPGDPTADELAASHWAEALSTGSRYQVLHFHARGGLGEVHVARDQDLDREVALKRLQSLHARNPQSRERFLREAAITSRLEHPSIVPVHSMGQDAAGCPFYAMRFVQGQTLQEAIQQFHAAKDTTPGQQHLVLRQLLSRFVTVCNTVAYAHSRGVVHRDLKPNNIMLGPYSETLVLDWGLAKDVTAPQAEAPSGRDEIAPVLPTSSSVTQEGTVIGTPAYMSPEQAEGRWEAVGPASDVYSLGATLYAILTGHAPFESRELGELLVRVKHGKFVRPRDRQKDIPRALEAICLKAMAREPRQRYAAALDIATDLEHWLADEPVSAYADSLVARLARWGRRHRPLVAAAAALLLTAVGLLSAAIVLINQEKDRTRAAYAGLEREQQRTAEALEAESKRRQQTFESLDMLSSQVVEEWLAKQTQLLPEHRKFLVKAAASYEELARDTGQEEASRAGAARAYANVGKIRWRLGEMAEAEAACLRSRELWQQLAAEFPGKPEYRRRLSTSYNNLAALFRDTRRSEDAERAYRDSATILTQLVADFPDVPEYLRYLGWSYRTGGELFYRTLRMDLAEQAYKQAQAVGQRLADAYPEVVQYQANLAQSYMDLGLVYKATGRAELAKQAYQQARVISQGLADAEPLVPDYQRDLAASYNNLAMIDKEGGATDSAEQAFLQARTIHERLAATYPQLAEYQGNLAASHNNLGTLYRSTRRPDLAEPAFEQARVIYQRLADVHPEVGVYTMYVGGVCWNLGHMLRDELGKPQQALESYAHGIGPLEALLRKDPNLARAREVLFVLYAGRAVALALLSRHAEAAQALQRAEDVDQGQSRGQVHYFGNDDIRSYRARLLVLAGEHARATAEAEELIQNKALEGSQFYDLTFTFALAAAAGQEDGNLADADRVHLSEHYGARAVELCRKAQAAGYFHNAATVEELRTAKQLGVLRSRDDFQKLVNELQDNRLP